jgi:hypothetical protein
MLLSVIASIVLAAALIWSGVAKLRHFDSARRQTIALIGQRFGAVVGSVLPFVELGLAVLLVVWPSWIPAAIAIVLLLAFSAVLVRAHLRQLPCPCFGGGGDAVGTSALVRNGALLACAVLALGR